MIEINNLVKVFGNTRAVDGVNFSVRRGEVLGFLGPNGAGKTTTMKIISGFFEPTAGTVLIDGLDVVKHSLKVRRKIGYLPETVPLYDDMKVFEYLKFVAEIRDLEKDKILPRLKEVVAKCGLSKVTGKTVDELSKGFRQRVGLAQAIIHDPDILILDEPTTGLDPNQIMEIRDLIRAIGRQKTVLFSTHILAEAQATCDRIVIINQGRIVGQGSPAQLIAQSAAADIIDLKVKGPVKEVLAVLSALPAVAAVLEHGVDLDEVVVCRLESKSGEDAREAVSLALTQKQWPLLELTRRQASLEEVFKQLTK